MARNLLKHQPINIYNRTKEKGRDLVDQGATWYDTPKDLARASSLILIMVTDDNALRDVIRGDHGVLQGIQPDSLVLDHSTLSPKTTREMASLVEGKGCWWADAPVTGGDVGAENGTLTIMVGARRQDFERIEPYLRQMGQRILHVGELGQGQTLKLVSNMVSSLNLMAAAEGLQFAMNRGLGLEDIETVMSFGSAQSYELTKMLERLKKNDYTPGFSVANRLKDFRLAIELAEQTEFSADLGRCALPLYQEHAEQGFRDEDESSYIKRWNSGGRHSS
ncbi:MAG: NAD(P)-dependent oxidoreductase [Firmicutes bacterium]|jgi:3-hydroxyisobutyrate dehydrogenase|nr:NAD(P)-dependent oxidoreductase [Bacillota bacterium]MCL5013125.1 NAD(P)-dependent oxidoreductase [Bacillota bacterium]